MKLTRFSPSFDLGRVSDFDQWLRNPFSSFPAFGQLLGEFVPGVTGQLSTDVHEDKDNYYARFETPGIKKEDVKIELHDRLLTVTAQKQAKKGDAEQSFSLTRTISVPEGVNGEAIGAKLEDGILLVTLPKQENRKPRSIEIA